MKNEKWIQWWKLLKIQYLPHLWYKNYESLDYQGLVGELQKEYLKEVEKDKAQELQNEVCVCSCLTNLKGMVYTILEPLFKSKWASIVPTNNLDLYLGCVSHFEKSNWIILNFFSTYNNLDMYLKYVQQFENSNWILFNLLCFDNNLHMGLCFV